MSHPFKGRVTQSILENRASQPRNADPPQPGQHFHEMGRHKCIRSILGGKLYRIPARIDLDRSRPLKLNFFNPRISKKMSKSRFLRKFPGNPRKRPGGPPGGLGSVPCAFKPQNSPQNTPQKIKNPPLYFPLIFP